MADFFLNHGSYLGIFLFMVLTGAGLPVPEEVAIVAAGVLSSHGEIDPWLAFTALLAGGLAGDCVMYWIGHHFGRAVIREHRWWAHYVTPEREARIEILLYRHGLKMLFVARFLVGLRSPVYLAAGILRLPFRKFLLFDLLCATAVIGTFFGLSYFFVRWITDWLRNAEILLTVLAIVAIGAAGIYYWRRHRRKSAETGKTPAEDLPDSSQEEEHEQNDTKRIA